MKIFYRKGTILLLSLFLIIFAIAIFGIGYLYVRNSSQQMQITNLKSSLIPMYEIYNMKLVEMVNKHVYQISDPPTFLDKINFIFIESNLNANYVFDSLLDNEEIFDGYQIIDKNQVSSISRFLRTVRIVDIGNLDSNNQCLVSLSDENSNTLAQFYVNLSPFINRRREFLDNFTITESEIKSKVKEYMDFFVADSLRGFIKGFKEYENGKLVSNVILSPTNFSVNNFVNYWEVYVPYSIEYKLKVSKKYHTLINNHKNVLYLRPYYIINLIVEVGSSGGNYFLRIKIVGSSALSVYKVIRKY
ncbi:MAG: hypothetical protein RMJ36_01970 [Candidatus Calescibacterium sp.]|nr:hypothetical protein [Candidatus Calescibacterium sp.]MDW8132406.1 hypothetical protein [Candidatus Calescibacterium sp.]